MKIKTWIFLTLIILLAAALRFVNLDRFPPGFYSDESLYGYEAYSVLKTGRDEFGNFMPLAFKAFGDYRPPLYIYATVPFVAIFGLSEFAVRFPSALFSLLTVFFVYLLSKDLFKDTKVSLIASFLFAISPWSIFFARMAHDTNLTTLIIVVATWLFLKGFKNHLCFIFSIFLFFLSLYGYYNARVFVPLFGIFLVILYREEIIAKKHEFKTWVTLGLLVLLMTVPLVGIILNKDAGWSRVDAVSLWGKEGVGLKVDQLRGEDVRINSLPNAFMHNKITDSALAFSSSYLSHFDAKFLLFEGDPNKIYRVPDNGILLWLEPIFLIAGFWQLRKNKKNLLLLSGWLLLALLPDSLTKLAPAAPRIHLALPVVSMIGGLGLSQIFSFFLSKKAIFKVIVLSLLVLIGYNLVYFLHSYTIHLPVLYAREWHYGLKETVEAAGKEEGNFDQIWVSRRGWGWINFVFFLKYPPDKFQKEAVLTERNEYGLGWVNKFGKYYMDYFPPKFDLSKNILYIGEPPEFPQNIKPLKIVYYQDKNPAYYLVSTKELKTAFEASKLNGK